MILRDILNDKGTEVHLISPNATLDDAVSELIRCNVGSLIVCGSASEGGQPSVLGIITERDVLRAQVLHRSAFKQCTVASAMSPHLVTATPTDSLDHAMRLMTEHRVRHLPIVDDLQLHGLVSIGDVVKAQCQELLAQST
ncbi:MAG: CBS domain-containing protein [Planctomycetia bacterium]|nr:CBS domain-containing protein [Planctomycetia bacterium]